MRGFNLAAGAAALALSVAGAACDHPTPERIRRWQADPATHHRLRAAAADAELAPDLRAQAGAALIEVGAAHVLDGLLAGTPPDERQRLIVTLAPLLGPRAAEADPGRARAARDGLFLLLAHAAAPGAQAALAPALVPILREELRLGRTSFDGHDVAGSVARLGRDGIAAALTVLADPAAPIDPAWRVLAAAGDDADRDRAARLLLAGPGGPRGGEALWGALVTLGGDVARGHLMYVLKSGAPGATAAAAEIARREDPGLRSLALEVLRHRAAPAAVRVPLLGFLGQFRNTETRDAILALMPGETDPGVRFAAFDAVIAVGGGGAAEPALSAFPEDVPYRLEELQARLVTPMLTRFKAADRREAYWTCFHAQNPLPKLVAMLALERLPNEVFPEELAALARDPGVVAGLPRSHTVAAQARRLSALLARTFPDL